MTGAGSVTSARNSLNAPAGIDEPWQENVRLSWPRPTVGAGWGRVTAQAYCRYPIGAGHAESGCEKSTTTSASPSTS